IGVKKSNIVIIKRKKTYYFAFLTNREFIITLEAIPITKNYILAFLILSGSIYIAR
ncbi:uncharacterized protein CLUP02_09938, partial [Colletotrichum lupini]